MDTIEKLKNRLKSETDTNSAAMPVHVGKMVTVTVAELKAACAAQPAHPVAQVYSKLKGKEDREVTVDATDLNCLLHNCEVLVDTSKDENGREVVTKSKGDLLSKPAKVQAAPTKSVDPSGAPK